MMFQRVTYASIEELDYREYGEENTRELVEQSRINFLNHVKHQNQSTDHRRRDLVCEILKCGGIELQLEEYLLAVNLLDRLLLGDFLDRYEHHIGEPNRCVLIAALVRLAVKYEVCDVSYSWLYRGQWWATIDLREMQAVEMHAWKALDHDLHWPTAIHFVNILMKCEPGGTGLRDAVETMLVLVSLNDYFSKVPAHTTAAIVYNLGCRLLCLVPVRSIAILR